jgi:hypothetical protein
LLFIFTGCDERTNNNVKEENELGYGDQTSDEVKVTVNITYDMVNPDEKKEVFLIVDYVIEEVDQTDKAGV